MGLSRDDKNMVPEWMLQKVMEYETTARGVVNEKEKFQGGEPEAAETIDKLVRSDLELLVQAYGEVFELRPEASKHIFFLLWRAFLRGWHLGEAKWKSGSFALPEESRERNPDSYLPRSEDF